MNALPLRCGDVGSVVAQVRSWLIALGEPTAVTGAERGTGLSWVTVADPQPPDPSTLTLRLLASAAPDGPDSFDADLDHAVRMFQHSRGLRADGVVGVETYQALEGARWRLGDRPLHQAVSHPYCGDDVAALQTRLLELGFNPGRVDAWFGPRTEAALRDFQVNYGLAADGTVGADTLRALRGLRRTVVGGRAHELREAEALRHRGPALAGLRVVLDPGHGGDDDGWVAHGLTERAVVGDLAARLEGRLGAAGAVAWLTHGPDSNPTEAERAAFANATNADLVVSLHLDGHPSPRASGAAAFYFGAGPDTGSVLGERLAGLVQRELVARTGLPDARTHPRTWQLLRSTTMPAVRVEPGYLTCPEDAAALADPAVRDAVADAVLVAVQRLFLPAEADPPTGVLRLPLVG